MGPSPLTPDTAAYPRRFRETESINRQLARPLRLVSGVHTPDPGLLDTIGRRLLTRDETGATLARAMLGSRTVTRAQFTQALHDGITPDAPQPLRDFFTTVDTVPDWVDFGLVNAGGRAFRRLGRSAADVLLQLSLIGSYRFTGPADLLVETGGLTGARTQRRLAETQAWTVAVTGHDALRRTGAGFRLTVHVRLMHALVNHRFETSGRWDIARFGLPVNQADLAATLGLFSAVPLLGTRLLGVRVTRSESRAVMHLWRYVGWLLGVDADWLCDSERDQHRLNYHILLSQSYGSAAGPPLARAIVETQRKLHFGQFAALRGRYARLRLLSMLSYFLGPGGMRDLDLRYHLPWTVPPLVAANLVRYHLLGRTRAGREYLQRRGERAFRTLLRRYSGQDLPGIGELNA